MDASNDQREATQEDEILEQSDVGDITDDNVEVNN